VVKPKLKSLKKISLLNDAVASIQQFILDGKFSPGSVLPSEGRLGENLGVSRTIIREAMRVLEARGLVNIGQGRRPQVSGSDPAAVSASLDILVKQSGNSLLDLVEVRRGLESEAAFLSAQRATRQHIDAMQQVIEEFIASGKNIEKMAELDLRFHELLAESTGNIIFKVLAAPLAEMLKESHRKTLGISGTKPTIAGHLKILNAIKRHSPSAARKAMLEHIGGTERDLKQQASSIAS
jgi:GntR family transcriptional regulator, transcriptional repressor for pyruvate dehydrogenase complex